MTLTGLNVYPIKSLRGTALTSSMVEHRGLAGDRRWMVVDHQNEFITQREVPPLALVEARITEDGLVLSAPGMSEVAIARPPHTSERSLVRVWKDTVPALPASEEAREWITRYLGFPCNLIFMPDTTMRRVNPQYALESDVVSFADAYPILLASTDSLGELNRRLPTPLPMNRFRPNLVVSGGGAFAEDGWMQIRIGRLVFDVVKPCDRCAVTTIDQTTGERGTEPLRTLALFRRCDGKVYFGQNLIPRSVGRIEVCDPVEVLEVRSEAIVTFE